jgi:hypothetical protein
MNNIPPKISNLTQQQKLKTPPKLKATRSIKVFFISLIIVPFCLMIFFALAMWSAYNSVVCDNCYAFHGNDLEYGEFSLKNNIGKICDNCDNKMESYFHYALKEDFEARMCSHCNVAVLNQNDLITTKGSESTWKRTHKKCNKITMGLEVLIICILLFSASSLPLIYFTYKIFIAVIKKKSLHC